MDFGQESGDNELAEQLIWDWRSARLPDEDRALCAYAEKLTRAPGAMTGADVQALRDHGFSDEQIAIAAQVIAYFNYINRIADGLGVDDEPEMAPAREAWLRRPR